MLKVVKSADVVDFKQQPWWYYDNSQGLVNMTEGWERSLGTGEGKTAVLEAAARMHK